MKKTPLCAMALCFLVFFGCSPDAGVLNATIPPAPTFPPTATPVQQAALPETAAFEGEWGGMADSDGKGYVSKLTVLGDGAFLAMDSYLEPAESDGAYFDKSEGMCGIKLVLERADDSRLTFIAEEYAYNTMKDAPYKPGDRLEFEAHESGRLLFGSLELSLLNPPGAKDFPRWNKQLNDVLEGVRGMFEFSGSGAKLNVFVYEGEDGFERVRGGYGDITHVTEQDGKSAFIATFPMRDLLPKDVDPSNAAPYWDSVFMLDVKTGHFADVSKEFLDYYRDELIPRFEEALLLAIDERDEAPKEEREAYQPLIDAYTEALFRAHELVEGSRPDELTIDVPETEMDEDVY